MKPWYSELLESDEPEVRRAVAEAIREQRPAAPVNRVGCIVEFVQGRECRCGAVKETIGRRAFSVVDLAGKARRVRARHILDFSQQQLPVDNDAQLRVALRRIDQRRKALQARLDLQTLWEVLSGNGEEWWDLAALMELYFSATPEDDQRTALVRALAQGDYFEMLDGQFKPHTAAVVQRKKAARQARQQAAAQLAEQTAWLARVIAGDDASPPASAAQAIALLEEAALSEGESVAPAAGQLMRRLHLHGPLAAFDLLVRLGHWDMDENLDLHRLGIASEFASALVAQAQVAPWCKTTHEARRWWGRQVIGWSTAGEECAQAFSLRRTLGGYRLGIHCAVPGLLLEDQGPLLAEARLRGTAVHLPDRRIGMVPLALEKRALLCAGERQPALSLVVQLDTRWVVRSFAFSLRRVRLSRVLALQACDGEESALLRRLALCVREQRQQQGALLLPPEKSVALRQGQIEVEDPAQNARWFLDELDYLAWSLAGAWCQERAIPAVYQTQPWSTAETLPERWDPVLLHEQLKHTERIGWQVEPAPNQALGLAYCSPWSRPLESYLDLLMQQQIVAALTTHTPHYAAAELERMVEETVWSRDAAWQSERRARRYWLLKALEKRVGDGLEGTVVERLGAACLVLLDEYPLKVFVPPQREAWANRGDRIRLSLAQVGARRDLIRVDGSQRL